MGGVAEDAWLGFDWAQGIFGGAEGAGEVEPDAGDDEEDGAEVTNAEGAVVDPAPAEEVAGENQYEAGDDEDGEGRVGEHEEVGGEFAEHGKVGSRDLVGRKIPLTPALSQRERESV